MKDVKDLREYEGEEGAQRAATLLKAQQQSKDAGHLNNSAETQLNNSTEG